MSANPEYPRTRYGPAPLADLSDPAERNRLATSAAKAFFNITDRWQVRDTDSRALLGGLSNGSYYALKRNPEKLTDQDKLQRVSLLIGIFKALNILYSEQVADRWIMLPNNNPIFTGQTPLAYLIQGGLPAFITVRRLLDARRGG